VETEDAMTKMRITTRLLAAALFATTLAIGTVSLAQAPEQDRQVLSDAKPPVQDGGPRSGPIPESPHPMAYGILFALLAVGAGIGVAALIVIRRWDRNRPIERETEAHSVERLATYEKQVPGEERL
jgi:hypothetical protein